MSLKSGGIRGGQLYAMSHSLIYISNMGYRRILGVNSGYSQKYNGTEIQQRKWKKVKFSLIFLHVGADKSVLREKPKGIPQSKILISDYHMKEFGTKIAIKSN